MSRILSVSAAPYDGHPAPLLLESLARCGIRHVEPAYIVGYTEPFDETVFSSDAATAYRRALAESGLACHALSAHIDLGTREVLEVFRRRMDFARAIGARIINTNASLASRETQFRHNIDALARHGEAIGLTIGLENPGNGEANLFNHAAEGLALIEALGLPSVRLNYDPANLVSHRPGLTDPAEDAIIALPGCAHFHLKDAAATENGWRHAVIGQGLVDYPRLLAALAGYPDLPVSIELPLRLRRGPDAQPIRAATPLPIAEIEAAIRDSLDFLGRFGVTP